MFFLPPFVDYMAEKGCINDKTSKIILLKIYQILIPKLSISHHQNAETIDVVLFLSSFCEVQVDVIKIKVD